MQKFSIILMAVVILFGLVLTVTPFIGSIFFQLPKNSTQLAKAEVARAALSQWFNAPVDALADVQAIRQTQEGKKAPVARYSFSTDPEFVRKFILKKRLQQKDLTEAILHNVFSDSSISWWHPEALRRETWFYGKDQGKSLSLIYNAETHRGVLVIE